MSPGTAQISPRPTPINAAAIDPICASCQIRPNSTTQAPTLWASYREEMREHSGSHGRRRNQLQEGQRLAAAGPCPARAAERLPIPTSPSAARSRSCNPQPSPPTPNHPLCPPLRPCAQLAGPLHFPSAASAARRNRPRFPGVGCRATGRRPTGRQVSISAALRPLAAVSVPICCPGRRSPPDQAQEPTRNCRKSYGPRS